MTSANNLNQYLRTRCTEIDAALNSLLPSPPACPQLISEAMRYSVFAGGKRLRPILTLAAAEAVIECQSTGTAFLTDLSRVMPGACAVELIHTYSLVHDDLPAMDDDKLRRGRPTAHVVFGEGTAILAGDALLTHAFAILAQDLPTDSPETEHRRLRAIARIAGAAGAAGMVGGQVLDLAETGAKTTGKETLRDIHERKTGALINAAAVSGAILAGADRAIIEAIDAYATNLGLAFQIVDDILDVVGTTDGLGKTAGKDASANKPTYPSIYGLARSRSLAAEAAEASRANLATIGLGGRLGEISHWVVSRTS